MLCGIEPKNVLAVMLHSLCRSLHAAGIVAAALCEACASDSRTDKFVLNINSRCMKSAVVCGIVRTNRTKNDDKTIMLCRKNAERNLVAEDERSDIKSCARLRRNPVLINGDKLIDSVKEDVLFHMRDTHTVIGSVHTLKVLIRSEKLNVARRSFICLHALKHHLGIVEHA